MRARSVLVNHFFKILGTIVFELDQICEWSSLSAQRARNKDRDHSRLFPAEGQMWILDPILF